jgi:hypothetical protein
MILVHVRLGESAKQAIGMNGRKKPPDFRVS